MRGVNNTEREDEQMIKFKHHGSFENAERFFKRASRADVERVLEYYGNAGVQALASATPVDSGETASGWGFEINASRSGASITWTNSNVNKGVNIAIILQYGHGTGTGGYVQGRDYINPALQPIFDSIAQDAWREVTGK